ncbi:hypothetical protein, partial [Escherichia coli]
MLMYHTRRPYQASNNSAVV